MNQLFPAQKRQKVLKTSEKGFNVTHNWRDVLYNYQGASFCTRPVGRPETLVGDCAGEVVRKEACSYTAGRSGN